MVLSSAKVADVDQFWSKFSTKGAEKRKQFGSKGARAYRDPSDPNKVWAIIDWEMEDYKKFSSDPEVQELFKEAGLQGPPEPAELLGELDS